MSTTGQSQSNTARDCLDFQLSLALERMEKEGGAHKKNVSIPVPPGSVLEKKIADLIEGEAPQSVDFEEAMALCSKLEKK